MKLRIGLLIVASVGIIGRLGAGSNAAPPQASALDGHASPAIARITLSDGSVRTVAFDGLGCSAGMCSRHVLRGAAKGDAFADNTWLDTVAAIKNTSEA